MGNSNGSESVDSQLLQRLPSGTAWSFQKCVAHNSPKPESSETPTKRSKKNNNNNNNNNNDENKKENFENQSAKKKDKSPKKSAPVTSEATTGSTEGTESEGIKFQTWEIPQSMKEYIKARDLIDHVGCKDLDVEKIMAVYNPTLVQPFTTRLAIFKTRFTERPDLFMKPEWKRNDPGKLREKVMNAYDKYVSSFGWNQGAKVPVVPCVTEGTEEEILELVKFGFESNSTASYGRFGKGIYINTPALSNNNQNINNNVYEKSDETKSTENKDNTESERSSSDKDNDKKKKVFLISYTIPGNVFPVTRNDLQKLQGNPVRNGYNSHLVLADPKNPSEEVIDIEKIDEDNYVGEFVIEQQSQIIPAFVVYAN